MRPPGGAAGGSALALLAVLLVATNLRGAIAAVSPVLLQIRAELALSPAVAGLLTTLPVLCFAAAAPASAWLGRRAGLEPAVLVGLLAIAAGTVLRVAGGTAVLLAGTVVLGIGMTVGNVLVPALVKRDFPRRAGAVTGLYTAALCAGAAGTAALTAPLAARWGWRGGLAAWAVLALAAAVLWLLVTRSSTGTGALPAPAAVGPSVGLVWRHPVAWALTLLLGFQSVAYYAVTAWLPTLLVEDLGLDLGTAGLAMSVFQVLGIAGTLVIPALAGRRPGQQWLSVAVAGGWAAMLAGLLLWPAAWPVWTVVGGVAQGAGISLAFTLLVLRARDADVVRALSGMSQLVGYALGAAGPTVVGAVYAASSGWTAPLVLLLAVCAAMAAAGTVAGRNVSIGAAAPLGSR